MITDHSILHSPLGKKSTYISHYQCNLLFPIPRNVRLAEAPSHGLPVLQYDEKSQGSVAYLTLAGEILRRMDETLKIEEPVKA